MCIWYIPPYVHMEARGRHQVSSGSLIPLRHGLFLHQDLIFFFLVWQPELLRDPPGSTTHSFGVIDMLETKPACSVGAGIQTQVPMG